MDTYIPKAKRYWRGEARGLRASVGTGRHRDPEISFQFPVNSCWLLWHQAVRR